MSSVAITGLYESTVGKKAIVATTGIILFAFVVLHLLGNLQVFMGPERLNAYGRLLRVEPALLWGARAVLLVSVVLHIVLSVQLTVRNWGNRPVRYAMQHYREADYAARTMIWSGPIIAAFVVYHLLHFTFGTVHPSFVEGDVYHNVVAGFQVWPVSVFYILANALLGLHLYHGLWSLFQTLGVNQPWLNPLRRTLATAFAVFIAGGNILIPVSVLVGWVR